MVTQIKVNNPIQTEEWDQSQPYKAKQPPKGYPTQDSVSGTPAWKEVQTMLKVEETGKLDDTFSPVEAAKNLVSKLDIEHMSDEQIERLILRFNVESQHLQKKCNQATKKVFEEFTRNFTKELQGAIDNYANWALQAGSAVAKGATVFAAMSVEGFDSQLATLVGGTTDVFSQLHSQSNQSTQEDLRTSKDLSQADKGSYGQFEQENSQGAEGALRQRSQVADRKNGVFGQMTR